MSDLIVAFIGAIGVLMGGGGIYALARVDAERRKLHAEADRLRAETTKILEEIEDLSSKSDLDKLRVILDALSKRVEQQDRKIEAQAHRIAELEAENLRLCRILRTRGIDPSNEV